MPGTNTYNSLQPYLIIKNCAEGIEFYKKAFGATECMRMTAEDGRIGHAEMQFGESVVMMADEHPEIGAFSPEHYGGSPVSINLNVANCDPIYQQAIAAGATTERAPADQSYGARNAGVRDPFGYKWWISAPVRPAAK